MRSPWDNPPNRKSPWGKRHVAIVVAGIAAGVGIGVLLPAEALHRPGGDSAGQTTRIVIPEIGKVRPGRDDTPLAPPPQGEPNAVPIAVAPAREAVVSLRFGMCRGGGGTNCVVDGDTFRHQGDKIRIADIDTPELNPARCAEEERLGQAAKARLQVLLNAGPFRLEPIPGRDEDSYGRKLRVVVRDGRALGDQLVAEGLARTWTGRREPWC